MEDNLEKLTKEELIEKVKELQTKRNNIEIIPMNGMQVFSLDDFHNKPWDIYLVKWYNGFCTRTIKPGTDLSKDINVVEFIGNEVDVLRPYVGNNWRKNTFGGFIGCSPAIIASDGPCSCQRVAMLGSIDKTALQPVPDEVLNKVYKYWEYIFPKNKQKPSSYEELKNRYNPQ